MIVSLKHNADSSKVQSGLSALGLWCSLREGRRGERFFVVAPCSRAVDAGRVLQIEGVEDVASLASPHPLVDAQPQVVDVGGVRFGGSSAVLIAGPCAVESAEQISRAAARLAPLGVSFLRGGAFKPRTSPYAFQGHGARALGWLRSAADAHGLGVITEALGESGVDRVARVADIIQIGSRNMQSFDLLRAVGSTGKPVLLKRGMAATVEEWLLAGEHLLHHGAKGVIFCERGIRGFDSPARNLLDLASVALLAHVHHQPVIVDPSHALGRVDLVPHLARAARAAGACGLMLETHDDPGRSMSDGPQALDPEAFAALVRELRPLPPGVPQPGRGPGTVHAR